MPTDLLGCGAEELMRQPCEDIEEGTRRSRTSTIQNSGGRRLIFVPGEGLGLEIIHDSGPGSLPGLPLPKGVTVEVGNGGGDDGDGDPGADDGGRGGVAGTGTEPEDTGTKIMAGVEKRTKERQDEESAPHAGAALGDPIGATLGGPAATGAHAGVLIPPATNAGGQFGGEALVFTILGARGYQKLRDWWNNRR